MPGHRRGCPMQMRWEGKLGHDAPEMHEALQNTDAPLPGVVCMQYVTRGNKRHVYYARFWRERGKLRKQYVRKADVERVRAACAVRREREAVQREFRARLVEAFGAAVVNAQRRAIRAMIADAVGENTARHVRR